MAGLNVHTTDDLAVHSTAHETATTSDSVYARNTESGSAKNNELDESYPFAYYEQLMRHDWHGKVHRRVRQCGWGR